MLSNYEILMIIKNLVERSSSCYTLVLNTVSLDSAVRLRAGSLYGMLCREGVLHADEKDCREQLSW